MKSVFAALFFCCSLALEATKAQDSLRRLYSDGPQECRARGMVTVASTQSLGDTYNALVAALDNNPNIQIVAEIDHSAAATGAGLELLPNRLVVFGNPKLGTPIMEKNAKAGLDLPQKMLVWQDTNNQVWVGYNPTDYIVARYPVTAQAATLNTIDMALKNLASTATGVNVADMELPSHSDFTQITQSKGFYSQESNFDFDTTLSRLIAAIEASPANIAFQVDHQANSGDTLRPSTLVVFGNPNIGTPLMQSSATMGIDLPLKILVFVNKRGQVVVATNRLDYLGHRHNLPQNVNLGVAWDAVLNFIKAATRNE